LFFLGEDSEELSSLPKGGSAGQYLVKISDEDGEADWEDLPIASASTSGIVTTGA
jgi:hypothetical protein